MNMPQVSLVFSTKRVFYKQRDNGEGTGSPFWTSASA
jgi:hypothetical protein